VHQVRVFNRWLAPYDALTATHRDIERFLDERRGRGGRPLDRSTRCQWIGGFAAFYRWAIIEELTTADPTVRVIRLRHAPRDANASWSCRSVVPIRYAWTHA
jgi:hypothetical protein